MTKPPKFLHSWSLTQFEGGHQVEVLRPRDIRPFTLLPASSLKHSHFHHFLNLVDSVGKYCMLHLVQCYIDFLSSTWCTQGTIYKNSFAVGEAWSIAQQYLQDHHPSMWRSNSGHCPRFKCQWDPDDRSAKHRNHTVLPADYTRRVTNQGKCALLW